MIFDNGDSDSIARRLLGASPFIVLHLLPLGFLWTGVTTTAVVVCVVLFWVRMFSITAGYHRYFAHRSFKTGRVMQFVFAFLSQTSAQRGVLWWASNHRSHHKHSDLEGDPHSPVRDGFWYSHVGWIFSRGAGETNLDGIKDFAKYPELRFLDKNYLLPPALLGLFVTVVWGWAAFFGFILSTVILWHATFLINSLAHVYGSRRYETTDDSRNNWWLALLTMGEGWHNNHHRYMSSVRQGFFWWEVDMTYYILKVMSWLGLVWDLRQPPAKALAPMATTSLALKVKDSI